VFDTIAMLAVHRGGKRHRGYYETYLERKKELLIEKDKRAAELLLNHGKLQKKSETSEPSEEPLLAATKKRTITALYGTAFNADDTPAGHSSSGSFFQPAYAGSTSSSSKTTTSSSSKTSTPAQSAPPRRGGQGSQDHGKQFLAQYQMRNPPQFNPYSTVQTMSQGEIPYNSLAYKYGPGVKVAIPKLKKQKTVVQKIDPTLLNEERKRNRLYEKGYRWDEYGNMYRDDSVEWESDEENVPIKEKKEVKEAEQKNEEQGEPNVSTEQEKPIPL